MFLSRLAVRVEERGSFEAKIGLECLIYNLLMTLSFFFSKASLGELQSLKLVLLGFRRLLGLRINLNKSTLSGLLLGIKFC